MQVATTPRLKLILTDGVTTGIPATLTQEALSGNEGRLVPGSLIRCDAFALTFIENAQRAIEIQRCTVVSGPLSRPPSTDTVPAKPMGSTLFASTPEPPPSARPLSQTRLVRLTRLFEFISIVVSRRVLVLKPTGPLLRPLLPWERSPTNRSAR